MGLSRKQRKELKKLRKSAGVLWGDQRDVLDHATEVLREAGRQLGTVSKQEVGPRVQTLVDGKVKPVVSSTYNAGRTVASEARNKVTKDVIPGVSAAVASALATLESGRDQALKSADDALGKVSKKADEYGRKADKLGSKVGKKADKVTSKVSKTANSKLADVSKKASKAYGTASKKVGLPQKKSGLGFGGWALISLGVVLVAGLAYAAWQTLRADDELWVLDESDDTK